MAGPYAKLLRESIDQIVAVYGGVVEEWCERSLVDPEGRGVLLVWDEYPLHYRIGLSPLVPWAEIYEVR